MGGIGLEQSRNDLEICPLCSNPAPSPSLAAMKDRALPRGNLSVTRPRNQKSGGEQLPLTSLLILVQSDKSSSHGCEDLTSRMRAYVYANSYTEFRFPRNQDSTKTKISEMSPIELPSVPTLRNQSLRPENKLRIPLRNIFIRDIKPNSNVIKIVLDER